MKKLIKPLLFVVIAISYSCSAPAEKSEPVEMEPVSSSERSQKVVEHHLGSFGSNDLAAVMEDYTEESIVATPDTTFVGLQQIEGFFASLFPLFPTEGTVLELDRMFIENDLAYIVWHASTPSVSVPLGTDTYIILNDKITKQTFAGVINPVTE